MIVVRDFHLKVVESKAVVIKVSRFILIEGRVKQHSECSQRRKTAK